MKSAVGGGHHHGRSLSFNLKIIKKSVDQAAAAGGGGPTTAPKGCIAVRVGEELERFYVPVGYLNHPLFVRLLKEAEEEYDFQYQQGAITIPCHVEYFRQVRGMIDKQNSFRSSAGAGAGAHHHNNHHHRPPLISGCFRA